MALAFVMVSASVLGHGRAFDSAGAYFYLEDGTPERTRR